MVCFHKRKWFESYVACQDSLFLVSNVCTDLALSICVSAPLCSLHCLCCSSHFNIYVDIYEHFLFSFLDKLKSFTAILISRLTAWLYGFSFLFKRWMLTIIFILQDTWHIKLPSDILFDGYFTVSQRCLQIFLCLWCRYCPIHKHNCPS